MNQLNDFWATLCYFVWKMIINGENIEFERT
jgi:hypothetical protein